MKNKSSESLSSFLIGNKQLASSKQISNHFCNFFTRITEKNKQKHFGEKRLIFRVFAMKTISQFFF